jgi:hypothetical protein
MFVVEARGIFSLGPYNLACLSITLWSRALCATRPQTGGGAVCRLQGGGGGRVYGPLSGDAVAPTLSQAVFDDTQEFRYWLARIWDVNRPVVNFIMLNPSTADQYHDDPTVARCLHYARRWGYGTLLVTNIFAKRCTNPKALYTADDPIGPSNDNYLLKAASEADLRVVGWGTHGALRDRHAAVLHHLADFPLASLGATRDGFPKHPLYLRTNTPVMPYPPRSDRIDSSRQSPGAIAASARTVNLVCGLQGRRGRPNANCTQN